MSAKKLQQLVLLGLSTGLFATTNTAPAANVNSSATPAAGKAPADAAKVETKPGQFKTEAELLSKLDDKHKDLYNKFDAEHKELAMKMANATCSGANQCKGLASCKGTDHACAGQNKCAGTSGCKWVDMNKMIDTVNQQMSIKRSKTGY